MKSSTTKSVGDLRDPADGVAAAFAAIVDSFALYPKVRSGRMFGSIALKADGRVFAMLIKGELVVKLSKTEVDQLVRARIGRHFDPGHGKLMKEWVCVPAGSADWPELARRAHTFTKGGAS